MLTSFNPVSLSNAENQFLLEWLGKPPVVAMKAITGVRNPAAHPKDKNPLIYPDGVVPAAIKPILEGVYELQEMEKHEGTKWVGVEKVKSAIQTWLSQNAKWKFDHDRTRGKAPRYPSMYSFDARGGAHLGGPGSDSGMVRTYFGPAGERIPFEIDLVDAQSFAWTPPSYVEQGIADVRLKIDSEAHRIECLVPMNDGTTCGHTESYKTESRSSYNAARARMSKHLRKATKEVEAHRELHTLEFGSRA